MNTYNLAQPELNALCLLHSIKVYLVSLKIELRARYTKFLNQFSIETISKYHKIKKNLFLAINLIV